MNLQSDINLMNQLLPSNSLHDLEENQAYNFNELSFEDSQHELHNHQIVETHPSKFRSKPMT